MQIVDRASKKRILLSTTTKGLMQRYLSTHLDSSSSRLDRRTDPIGAPHCRCGGARRDERLAAGARGRVVVILAAEWRPTGRGRAKERASDARSVGGVGGRIALQQSWHRRALAPTSRLPSSTG
ncbi:hypothetical protein JYU34_012176 [Plutella xylostella]|uniref:Uncharacterized protein n=1 Tax=Plutella xylostella TaxID=51655 RepID=A0ABQ7QEK1_PLUXY|nr:hypothetical protein JYU34_012176 [Plutella xylostella]